MKDLAQELHAMINGKKQMLLNIEIYQPRKWDYSTGTGLLIADGEPLERPASAYSFKGEWFERSIRYAEDTYSRPFFERHTVESAIEYFTAKGYNLLIKKFDNSSI
jgi:hypothetical protein